MSDTAPFDPAAAALATHCYAVLMTAMPAVVALSALRPHFWTASRPVRDLPMPGVPWSGFRVGIAP